MAEAPSLSEITNITADPERGTGTPAVVIDTSAVVKDVQQAAQLKQENDWRKYTTFQNNLKDLYKSGQDIASMDMAPEDRKVIQGKLGGLYKKLQDDPQAFFAGGPKMAEIQGEIGKLLGDATQSKQDNLYDQAHREFLTRNPGWATPDNMKKVDAYLNTPLGQRKPFLLQPTPVLDFDAMSSSINSVIGKNVAGTGFTGVDKDGRMIPGNSYIAKTKGKEYPTDRYTALAESTWDQAGEYGIKNRDAAESAFKELPPDTQKAYGDAKNWYITQLLARHKENETDETTLVPNRFAEMGEKQKFDYGMEAYKQGNREALADYKHHLAMSGAPANINFLLRQYASIAGNKTGETKTIDTGSGKYEKEDVLNVPPDVLKKLSGTGKTTIKEGPGGKETTTLSQEPDVVTRTKDGDIRTIFYLRYKEGDKHPAGKKPGDIVVDKNGNQIEEGQSVIPKRQLMGLLGKDFVEKKLIGTSVDAADAILKKQGDGVSGFIDNINEGEDDDKEDESGESGAPTSKGIPSAKTYKFGNKTYTENQVSKAAKASGMTVDEYIKQAGLK